MIMIVEEDYRTHPEIILEVKNQGFLERKMFPDEFQEGSTVQ